MGKNIHGSAATTGRSVRLSIQHAINAMQVRASMKRQRARDYAKTATLLMRLAEAKLDQ